MTLPRTAAEVLSGHVRLEVRCIDRVMLTFRQPRLQYGQGIHDFFCQHRGNRFVSSALMLPMTEHFAADIHHYIDTRRLDLIRFARGQSKDQVAKGYLAGKSGGDQILFVGVAQEKTRVWRTARRRDPATGRPYPWLYQEQAMVNHWYFYGFDADFGPFHIKFCGYLPYTGQICFNGHEYAKQQCLKEGIAFTALDNAFGMVSDAEAVQRICDGLTDQKIYRFAGKWLARLPQPFTRADEDADYRWQLSVKQIEFSTTMTLGRPLSGRIFFEQLIRDNLDIGRPDKVNLVFGRMIRQRGKYRTPGIFRTQVITSGTCPYLYLFYKKTQVKQYLKEGRALRTETTFNQPRDLGIGKELTNLAALAEAGYSANRRLLDAECISHDPAAGTAALEMLTSPVISTTCTRVPGMRFPDPRVQALLAACCALALRPVGFTSRDLRHLLAPSWEKIPGTCPAARSATTCAGSAPTRSSSASGTAAPTSSPPMACPPPCSSPGAVLLYGAGITGQLCCSGAQLTGTDSDGDALIANGMRVGGDVFLDEGFTAAGAVVLSGAGITGQLRCGDAQLTSANSKGEALAANGMRVGDTVYLDDGFTAAGTVLLRSASVDGSLWLMPTKLAQDQNTMALDATGAQIAHELRWAPSSQVVGLICLEDSTVGQLEDDWSSDRGSANGY